MKDSGRVPSTLLLCFMLLLVACASPVTERQEAVQALPTGPTAVAGATVAGTVARRDSPAGSGDAYTAGRYRLQAGELLLASEPDAIPALFADDTLFADAEAGSQEWADEDLVVGLVLGDEARAYPVPLLSAHEIVNDRVGGQAVAVTWCPLCYSALVFDRTLDRELTFGVSGYLLHNNLVMYDHQTNTLWSQVLAQGIRGAMRGERLTPLPAQMMSWGHWKDLHPETRVLSAVALGRRAGEVVDPYAGYYASGAVGIAGAATDERLPPKALVIGLVAADTARAYPLAALQAERVLNETVGGVPVLLVYAPALDSVLVYSRVVEGEVLAFHAAARPLHLVDRGSGSRWDLRRGQAVSGSRQGQRLEALAAPLVYWFAWSTFYPDTELFSQ